MKFRPVKLKRVRGSVRGLTLIEVLIVVAIIVTLIGILVPSIGHMQKQGNRANIKAQLQSISMGLQGYFTDFNAYPPSAPSYGGITANRGSAMLAQGIMGYLGPAADGAGKPADPTDLGFRTNRSGTGRVYGPYGSDDPKGYRASGNDRVFVDLYGSEILYYRSTRATASNIPPVPVMTVFGPAGVTPTQTPSYFVSTDNSGVSGTGNPGATGTKQFFLQLSNQVTNPPYNNYNGGVVLGSDTFILISAAEDRQYFGDDDIVVGR